MATYTSNINLKKPAQSDKIRIADFNGNADNIDAAIGADFGQGTKPSINQAINSLADGLAIIASGNVHAAITAGQFVYVRNHDTLSEGLYVASSNISANGTLSGSNLTADGSGGLNALNSKTTTQILSLSDIFSSLANNITGQATVIGNVITIYMQGGGITDTSSGSDIGTLKTKYKPNLSSGNYVIVPILSNTSPYTPVSSAWIYAENGTMKKYGSNGFYISVTYIFAG